VIVLDVPPHKVVRIDAEHVDEALELVRPMLQLSVQHLAGFRSLDEMVESLRDGWRDWQLWLIVTPEQTVGALILTMERLGGELVATFELLAGVDAQAWIGPLIGKFEAYLAGMFGVTQARFRIYSASKLLIEFGKPAEEPRRHRHPLQNCDSRCRGFDPRQSPQPIQILRMRGCMRVQRFQN